MRRYSSPLLVLVALLGCAGCGADAVGEGWDLFGRGDVAGARATFARVFRDPSSMAEGAAALGEMHLLIGVDVEAESMYRAAWAASPHRADYAVGYAEALLRQGREEEAYEAFLEALDLDADGPHVARVAGLVGDAHKVSRLTRTSTDNYAPRFGVDGAHVVYTSHVDGNAELMLLTLGARELRRLTDMPRTNEYGANYSPDGSSLLYSSVQHRTNAGLITLQASGSSTRNEAFMARDMATQEDRRLSSSPGPVGSPLYSPDGTRVVFEAIVDANLDIWTMAADGKDRQRLTTTTEDDGQATYHPAGDRIIFVRTFDRNFELMDMAVDGSDARQVTTTPYSEFGGSFSPDGKWFVYAVERGFATTELALMEWETRRVRPLSRVQGRCIQPAFSPDGTKVVFASDRSDYLELYLMDLAQPPNPDTLRRQLNARLRAGS